MATLRSAFIATAALLLGATILHAQVAPAAKPTEPNSFAEVTAQLDTGGSFLMYLSTESWLKGLSDQLAAVRDTPGQPARANRETYLRNFSLIVDGLRASGLEDLTGLGISAFPVAPGLTRQKTFLHHAPGHGDGYLWKLLGPAPHPLEGLKLLPPRTALALFNDFDPAQLADLLQLAIRRIGEPSAEQMYQQIMGQFSAITGLPAEEALHSLAGTAGLILTLDPERKTGIAAGEQKVTVPRPDLALLLPSKDDRIYQQLAKMVEANPGTIRTDEGDLHLRVATEMAVTPELKLRPAIARWKEWLIIASDESLLRAIIAASTNGDGFITTPEFKKLSNGLPTEGNGFQLSTESFSAAVQSFQSSATTLPDPAQQAALLKIMGAAGRQSTMGITSNLPTGWLSAANQFSSAPPHAFGTLLGNLLEMALQTAGSPAPEAAAKEKSPAALSLSQARQLALACHMYAADHEGKFPTALKDLVPQYVPDASVLKSPFAPEAAEGYQYTQNLTESSPPETVLLQDSHAAKAKEKVVIRIDGTEVRE